MKNKICYLFVFEGYSDWEPALAAAGLQLFSEFQVRTFSLDGKPITSAGNVSVTPQLSLTDLDASAADLVIIPGGMAWSEGKNREITPFVKKALKEGKTVAAICDATVYLGSEGLLDNIKHTSNDLGMLKEYVPTYKGESHYEKKPAVADEQIITASGSAAVPFAGEIFKKFGLLENEKLAGWFIYFHKPEFLLFV